MLIKQLEIQKQLLSLEESKKDVLVEGDVEKLDELLQKQTSLVLSSTNLENKREELISQMGLADKPYREIMEQYAPKDDEAINNSFEEMVEVLHQLKRANGLNNKIIQSRIASIKQYQSLFGVQEGNLTYNNEGSF